MTSGQLYAIAIVLGMMLGVVVGIAIGQARRGSGAQARPPSSVDPGTLERRMHQLQTMRFGARMFDRRRSAGRERWAAWR